MSEAPATPTPATSYFPDEVAVALCIYGEALDPVELTRLLGVSPTHEHKNGDRKTLRSPPWNKGAWIYEIRRFDPIDPNRMFEELLAGLPQDEHIWQQLASRFELRVDFAVHTDVGCTFVLSPLTVRRVAAIHAAFQIYIQAYGDNDA
jgi:Domain of unknown function (DUF4279)